MKDNKDVRVVAYLMGYEAGFKASAMDVKDMCECLVGMSTQRGVKAVNENIKLYHKNKDETTKKIMELGRKIQACDKFLMELQTDLVHGKTEDADDVSERIAKFRIDLNKKVSK